MNYDIELIMNKNEKAWKFSWKSFYNMIKNKLLILRKTLMKYLDKSFIWVSNSSVTASVLFVKKSDDSLCFCVNYHSLNNITWKNCYSLLLINETLEQIEKAKWFIKLNVIAVFHKIWIQKEQEWLTVFRTHYSLFEWMIIFFDLVNISSMFQKYINSVLRNYLDEFVLVYLNNILIFFSDSLRNHC